MDTSTAHPLYVFPCDQNSSRCVNGSLDANVTTNGTFSRNENLAHIEIAVQSVIFTLAVLGNSTVLLSLYFRRRHLTRMHVLMVHLSIADLFVAFGNVLPQLIWDVTFVFYGGDFLCKLVKYMQIVAMYASSYVLVMTAIDRYVALCHPFVSHKWSTRKVHQLVSIAWALSLLFSLPQLVIFSYKLNSYGMQDCWGTFEPEWTLTFYITSCTVLVYIIPTIILIFCYGSICLVVWRAGNIGERLTRLSQRFRSTSQASANRNVENDVITSEGASNGASSKKYIRCVFKKPSTHTHERSDVLVKLNGGNDVTHDPDVVKDVTCTTDQYHHGDLQDPEYKTKPTNRFSIMNCCKTKTSRSASMVSHNAYELGKLHAESKPGLNLICSKETDQVHRNSRPSVITSNLTAPSQRAYTPAYSAQRRHSEHARASEKTTPSPSLSYHSGYGRRKSEQHGISRAKIRTVKLTLAVVLCYLICWSPFFIAQMWAVYDPTAPFYGKLKFPPIFDTSARVALKP